MTTVTLNFQIRCKRSGSANLWKVSKADSMMERRSKVKEWSFNSYKLQPSCFLIG